MGKPNKGQTTMDGFTRTPARPRQEGIEPPPQAEERPDTQPGSSLDAQTIRLMFQELQKGIGSINDKFDEQATRVSGMQTAVDGLKSSLGDAVQRIEVLESTVTSLSTRLRASEERVTTLQRKTCDLEGRSRRNNVRIVGLPESTQTGNMEQFIEKFLKQVLKNPPVSALFMVERAHRSLAPRPPPGAASRPIIARILNYRDRDILLQAAREHAPLQYNNATIMIFPDYALEVQTARRAFDEIKKILRQHKIVYSILYPAKLRVIWNDQTLFFDNPEKAAVFVRDKLGSDVAAGGTGWNRRTTSGRRRHPARGSRMNQNNQSEQRAGLSRVETLDAMIDAARDQSRDLPV